MRHQHQSAAFCYLQAAGSAFRLHNLFDDL